ncbi:putative IS200/IS605 family transposase ISBth16 [Pillotina sp. SPG140]
MSIKVDFENKTVKLLKIPAVCFRHTKNTKSWYRQAELKNITISRDATGKYFASCLFEGEADFKSYQESTENVIGLDMSMQEFYVDSLGNSPKYERKYRKSEIKLSHAQKLLSRKTSGSKNREKARVKVALLHEDIRNWRHNFLDQLSNELTNEYDVIVVESLSLKGMSQGLHLGKSVMD